MTTFTPTSADDILSAVQGALAEEQPLDHALGERALTAPHVHELQRILRRPARGILQHADDERRDLVPMQHPSAKPLYPNADRVHQGLPFAAQRRLPLVRRLPGEGVLKQMLGRRIRQVHEPGLGAAPQIPRRWGGIGAIAFLSSRNGWTRV